jgi:hypothetical protein
VAKDPNAKQQFECLCDAELFDVVDSKTLGTTKRRMQSCELKNICQLKNDKYNCNPESDCHYSMELKGGDYAPFSYCTCKNSTLILPERKLSCKDTCSDKCGNFEVCGHDLLQDKFICHCKEGFGGDKCETKSEAAKDSKAFMIATIVVSIIAAIALIGLAVLFFRNR